jgi:lipopolysaccharide biosynthesis regulator YciM
MQDPTIDLDEVVPRADLTQTGETDHGPVYECPRCGYRHVSEYCDCPFCGWAGMCQEEWVGSDQPKQKAD